MNAELASLRATVQKNCDIADARHAADYTLCIYLLKMREYYRWEQGYSFTDALPQEDVGGWIREREDRWNALENADFAALEFNGATFHPFDAEPLNRQLGAQGLVYSAGLGNGGRPHFFLGQLEQAQSRAGFTVLIAARELARDLTAPPAMTLSNTIFVRRESLRRMLWEKVEEWRWNRPDNALGRALACYDFETDAQAALDAMTAHELEVVVLHEIGEVQAGEHLGAAWNRMLAALPRSKAELGARAVRDHLADCLSTLPVLAQRAAPPSLHFYVANLSGMRKLLFPAILQAYDAWRAGADAHVLADLAAQGVDHWRKVAEEMLDLHRRHGDECLPQLEALLEQRAL